MKGLIVFLSLILPVGVSQGTGQEPPVPPVPGPEARIGLAAIDWYLTRNPSLAEHYDALVLSRRTTGGTPMVFRKPAPPPSGGYPLQPMRIEFPPEAMKSIRGSVQIPVLLCDSYDIGRNDLCGAPEPWVWLVPSNAEIEGDQAAIVLEVRWLEYDSGGANRPSRYNVNYDLRLTRRRGSWLVTSWEVAAVS